jgi:hypothetical protein
MPDDPDKPFISLVALLREHEPLSEQTLLEALDRAFEGRYSSEAPGHFFKAVIDGHQYLVWCGGAAFIIHNYPGQYFDGPAVAEYISDPQLAPLVADHQGSLSVDWLSGDAPEMQQWDYIGHLLAELSSERCVALLVPAKETVMPFRPNTIRLLRGPNVLERLGFSE